MQTPVAGMQELLIVAVSWMLFSPAQFHVNCFPSSCMEVLPSEFCARCAARFTLLLFFSFLRYYRALSPIQTGRHADTQTYLHPYIANRHTHTDTHRHLPTIRDTHTHTHTDRICVCTDANTYILIPAPLTCLGLQAGTFQGPGASWPVGQGRLARPAPLPCPLPCPAAWPALCPALPCPALPCPVLPYSILYFTLLDYAIR